MNFEKMSKEILLTWINDYRTQQDILAAKKEISSRLGQLEKVIKILEDAKETIEYCKCYEENMGFSAEDDCNISLKLINDFLEEINEKIKS